MAHGHAAHAELARNLADGLPSCMALTNGFPLLDPSRSGSFGALALLARRPVRHRRHLSWRRLGVEGGVLDPSPTPAQQLLERLAGTLHHMETVGHLDGSRRPLPASIGKGASPIAHEHLDTRVGCEPGDHGPSFVGVQHVHWPVGFQIDQHRGVPMVARERKLIDPEHPGRAPRLGC